MTSLKKSARMSGSKSAQIRRSKRANRGPHSNKVTQASLKVYKPSANPRQARIVVEYCPVQLNFDSVFATVTSLHSIQVHSTLSLSLFVQPFISILLSLTSIYIPISSLKSLPFSFHLYPLFHLLIPPFISLLFILSCNQNQVRFIQRSPLSFPLTCGTNELSAPNHSP